MIAAARCLVSSALSGGSVVPHKQLHGKVIRVSHLERASALQSHRVEPAQQRGTSEGDLRC